MYAGVFDEEVTDEEESGLVAAIDNDAENVKVSVMNLSTPSEMSKKSDVGQRRIRKL